MQVVLSVAICTKNGRGACSLSLAPSANTTFAPAPRHPARSLSLPPPIPPCHARPTPAALLSRQFVDTNRIRIEGLLAAFSKLISTEGSKQHTFVETDNVRCVGGARDR